MASPPGYDASTPSQPPFASNSTPTGKIKIRFGDGGKAEGDYALAGQGGAFESEGKPRVLPVMPSSGGAIGGHGGMATAEQLMKLGGVFSNIDIVTGKGGSAKAGISNGRITKSTGEGEAARANVNEDRNGKVRRQRGKVSHQ